MKKSQVIAALNALSPVPVQEGLQTEQAYLPMTIGNVLIALFHQGPIVEDENTVILREALARLAAERVTPPFEAE